VAEGGTMSAVAAEKREGSVAFRSRIILSPRVKFALKTALAITVSYMVPLAMGWNQPYQGAIAIMVIAAAGPLHETLGKGVMRILGTLAGAAAGLGLIALFPQDTFYYFLSLSAIAAILVYLYYAYRGDGTFLLVTLMVMVLLFDNGPLDDRFLYALDRSWTTAFGIFVYAMINLYLWPERVSEGPLEKIRELSSLWRHVLEGENKGEATSELLDLERGWEKALQGGKTEYPGGIAMDRRRWESLRSSIHRINRILGRMGLLGSVGRRKELKHFFPEAERVENNIRLMLEKTENWWKNPSQMEIPPVLSVSGEKHRKEEWHTLPVPEQAELWSLLEELRRLHTALRELLVRLDRIAAPEPDLREWMPMGSSGAFIRDDPELWRSTLRSMLVFWSGLLVWYLFSPPLGYMVAALGLVLSLVTFGLYVNPLALIAVYTLSFLFSFVAYVWILPGLYGGWELALYIFTYMFLTYWLIPVPLALFFALGLSFQYILNDRFFSVELFMAMLLLFYLFLGLMLFFYYLPAPNRPENAFLRAWRDWRHRRERGLCPGSRGRGGRASLDRMKFQAAKIDRRYFDGTDFEKLEDYLKEAERLTALSELRRDVWLRFSPALRRVLGNEECREWSRYDSATLKAHLESEEKNREIQVRDFFGKHRPGRDEMADLAEFFTIGYHALRSYVSVRILEEEIGIEQLKRSRF